MIYEPCPVCQMPAQIRETNGEGTEKDIECVQCGEFHTSHDAEWELRGAPLSPLQAAATSNRIRQNPGLIIERGELPRFRLLIPPSVGEKRDQLLLLFAKKYPIPSRDIPHPRLALVDMATHVRDAASSGTGVEQDYTPSHMEAVAYLGEVGATDKDELLWIIENCLIRSGWLEVGSTGAMLRITPSGWQEVSRLQQEVSNSQFGFVAMWFNKEVTLAWENAILPAIDDAGYRPEKIDLKEHNNHVDDEIIASIRRCRFLIADFTGNRGGVYYEAGFAEGLETV